MKNIISLFLCLLFIQTNLLAQVSKVTFSVDKERVEVSVNESFELVYVVEGEKHLPKENNLEFPKWNRLELISGPMELKQTHLRNGKITTNINSTFWLRALDTGTFIIPPATFSFNDTVIQSNPVEVVVKPYSLPSDSLLAEQIFIKTELHPAKAMVGEQVRMDIRVYGVNLPKIWGYDQAKKLEKEGLYIGGINYREHRRKENIIVDGKSYPSYILISTPIYAYHPGTFEIPPITMILNIQKDSVEQFFFKEYKKEVLETEPVKLEVYALNEEENPYPPVNGSKIKYKIIDSMLHQGKIYLDLTVSGSGDPIYFSPPSIGLEKVAKIQLDNVSEMISRSPKAGDNFRTFQYTISFLEKGEFEIHPKWVTWNTKMKNWDTLIAEPKTIIVPSKAAASFVEKEKEVLPSPISIPHDIIFALDLSSSMLTQDFTPSRIAFIQERIKYFINNETDLQRYGIVGFAGETGILCPLTSDTQLLEEALDNIQIGKWNDGTAIGDGLMHSLEVLSYSKAIRRTIVLLTDGVQNSGKFDPFFAAGIASQQRVKIVSLGMSTNEKAMTPFSRKTNGDFTYQLSNKNKIDDETLLDVTQKTNGVYLRVLEPEKFDEYLKQVLETENKERPMTAPSIDQRLLDIYFQGFEWKKRK